MQTIRKSLGLVLIMFVLCGFIFPLTVTALGQVLFPEQANGSLVKQDGKVIGSKLIGQQWTEPKYFHGRISAVNYNMNCLLYTSPSPRDRQKSRMPSSA